LCEQVLEIGFEAIAALGKVPPEYKAECPFPGLSSFGEKRYHKFFFGRDELIKNLQKELGKDNFLAVIGTSGSGKSSVVLAGLIPLLKEEEPDLRWAYLTPTREPIAQLDKRLEILSKSSDRPTLLVVDQFEEVFTLCEDPDIRQEFIQKLLKLAQRHKVVMTMRADFLGECTFYPDLRKRIETRQKLVGPMEASELVIAMKMQADSAGLRFEAGLSNAILNEVKGEPGAMPLLQYALQELWKRRHGRWLCDEEYQAIGRVHQAIAKTANDFYHNLPESEQPQVQNIFLRLTRLDDNAGSGENRRDTRRRVELEDLVTSETDLDMTKKLVQQLAGEGARLVVTSRNETTNRLEVEVAHEALIRHWPLLQDWLDQNRNDLQLRESIARAAQDWQKHQEQLDRDVYLIHHGGRLEDAQTLLNHPQSVRLNPLEAEYVRACVELRDRLRKLEQQRRQRQLFAATGAAFICGGFAIFAGYQWRKAEIQQIESFVQSAEYRLASYQGLDARIASTQAQKLLQRSFWQKVWPEADLDKKVTDKLYQSAYAGLEINRLKSEQGKIMALAVNPEGLVATGGADGFASIWDPSGKLLYKLQASEKGNDLGAQRVNGVAFNPQGTLLATAADDGIARIWNTEGKQLATLKGHEGPVIRVVFSPDGKLLATGGTDGTARLWDTEGKEVAKLEGHEERVNSVVFSPDGKLLATGGWEKTIYLWDTVTGNRVTSLEGHEGLAEIGFSPDGRLASGGDDGIITIWDTSRKPLPELTLRQEKVTSLGFSPDGLLAVGGSEGTVRLWDSAGNPISESKEAHQGSVYSITFRGDGLWATGGSDGAARLWDSSGKGLAKFPGHQGGVQNMVFSPDNRFFITTGYESSARIWDISALNSGTIQADQGRVLSVAFSDEGNLLATAGEGGMVRIWDNSGYLSKQFQGDKEWVFSVAFSLNGLLATGGQEGIVRIWDIEGNRLQEFNGDKEVVYSVAFSPNGRLATGGEEGIVRIWDTEGNLLQELNGDKECVNTVAFSPNGLLATGGEEGIVRIWDTEGNLLQELTEHQGGVNSVAFNPEGNLLATAEDYGIVRIWDTEGNLLEKLTEHEGWVRSVAFSPEGNLLATAGEDSILRIWDTEGNLLQELKGHQGGVISVAFNPKESLLVSGGLDGIVRVGPIEDRKKLLSLNCKWLQTYLNNQNKALGLTPRDRQVCKGINPPDNPPTNP
ncbi:MAG: eIF2A-related protein, partial [Chroococcales cyanobacterium]